jgi:L-asparagine oxygenase
MTSMIEVNTDELEILVNLADNICYNPTETPDKFCKQVKELSVFVPRRIKSILLQFVKTGSPSGFLLITGLKHIDTGLPNTPATNKYKIGEKTTLAKIQALFINIIGEMIAYEAEGYGRLFQDVVPDKLMANNQTSIGSNTELEIHTEQAFSELRPDFLSLACLRGDKSAITYILPIQTILENLSTEEIELLKQPLWYTGVDLSFKLNNHEFINGDIRGPMPILNFENNDQRLIFDQDLMLGTNNDANNLIKKIVDIYYKHRLEHNLQSGEIIIIDNRLAVHGRSPFYPNYDGKDRFIVRCFATLNYEKTKFARLNDERMVSAIYS